ncbi:MAG: FeoB-associated Cys-rich membrane protein [Phocaeicola sp.]
MENIQVLLIIAMIVFSVVKYLVKAKKEHSVPTTVEEPTYDDFDSLEEEFPPFTPKKPLIEASTKRTIAAKRNSSRREKEQQPITSPNEQLPINRNNNSIRLTNRSEAKRAFIYSEIFTRKY